VATYAVMPRQARGEQTKAAIIGTALALFAEKGFEATTMRGIADRAGVSLGSAYYYFASKEHLIQGFYDQVADRHGAVLPEKLEDVAALTDRLIAHLDLWLDLMAPYHSFAGVFFRSAADPASPLSPFSVESQQAREKSVELMRLVVSGAADKVPKTIAAELPELLWLYHMAVVLFWVHDRSHDVMASRLLVRRTVPMLVRAIELAKLPALKATLADLVTLISDLKMMLAASPA
jgi:AcrR family transcriptional regulator